MKKLLLSLALCAAFALPAAALNITDPLFMPQQGAVLAQSTADFTRNSFGLQQSIAIGINDNLSLGVALGWAKIKHAGSGLQDPSLGARYRFIDGANQGLYVDLEGYISPEVFDSPLNNDGGSAKGSTSFGLHSIAGSTEVAPNLTVAARTGFDYIGDTDNVDSGSIWSLEGLGKYYISEAHSLEANVALRGYAGFNKSFGGYGAGLSYAWEVQPETVSIIPFYYVEAHDHGIASSVNWGLNVRFLF